MITNAALGLLLLASSAAQGDKDPNEVICKRVQQTGSLVSHSRLCLTRHEWARNMEETRARYDEIQGRQGSSHEDQPTFSPH